MIKVFSIFLLSFLGFAKSAELSFSPEFILERVLDQKHLVILPDKKLPEILYSSQVNLIQFQDDIEPQWGFRPDFITNAYISAKNRVYLMDDWDYYEVQKRCIDDSLAHELTHFVQAIYQNYDLNDDSLEMEAVDIQSWFREKFCHF